jgi:hypothetical protein
VSVGGWTKIRLRRITRSSTCVCLRIRNYFVLLCAQRDMRAARYARSARPTLELHTRGSCCTLFHPCTLALRARSRAPRSRGSAAPPRLRAARAARAAHTQTPYLVPIAPMGFCTNWGFNRSNPLGASAVCVVLRAHRSHQSALATADPHNLCPLLQ